ncbi:glycerol-3-phosphate 1-O-acyltransferase PlsY [Streptococcus himalayensis]|uniref:Glycerol-3-phosphate acyltransferase n=1 Tax=Streptococcus himalayensis TaxID=1888195 RepID=A0A917EFK7_9STRE|nr:glycerol-3-phosphate 1-O-acyltransferase PlsY [Streptococcus himalayensis]GGE36795.1 glycerol-3-phosphate acyltransferase [Streptococcus himalayensis]
MIKLVLLLILAYLMGSVPAGLWIGQLFFKKNLREYGSGNTGTTNTFRVLGVKAGIATFAFDFLKGTVATLLPIFFGISDISPMIFGLLAVLGHTFPVFANFRGGKAVATSAGVVLGFAPAFFGYLFVLFFLTLYLGSMISLASILSAFLAIIGVLLFPLFHFLLPHYDPLFTLVITLLGSLIIVRHKDNIARILARKENLVPWGLNLTKQKPKI